MIYKVENKIHQRTYSKSYLVIFAFLLQIASFSFPLPAVTQPQDLFWAEWGDGRAEMNLYSSEIPRYGETRSGYSVLIYVTEDFSKQSQVKGEKPNSDSIKIMKLNHIKKFLTGIYDYSIMTSVFSPITVWSIGNRSFEAVTPIKVSFSMQEWCGNYYEQLRSRVDGYERIVHSYFEGEGDINGFIKYRSHAIHEDDLLIRARELVAPFPHGEYWILTSSLFGRFSHKSIEWLKAEVTRETLPETVSVPFGTFSARKFIVRTSEREQRIWVESGPPKRVLKWEVESLTQPGQRESSVLVNSRREVYWEENKLGFEYLRETLGIPVLK